MNDYFLSMHTIVRQTLISEIDMSDVEYFYDLIDGLAEENNT